MQFFQEVLVYVRYFLQCWFLCFLMLGGYRKKAHYSRIIAIIIASGILLQVAISALIYLYTPGYEWLVAVFKFALCILPVYFMYFAYKIRFLQMAFISFVAALMQRGAGSLTDVILSFIPYDIGYWLEMLAVLAVYAVMTLVVWLFYIRKLNGDEKLTPDGTTLFMLTLVFILFEVMLINIRGGTENRVLLLVLRVAELLFGIFMLYQSAYVDRKNRKLVEKMVQNALLAKERTQYEQLKSNIESMKAQVHDLKYVLRAIGNGGADSEAIGRLRNLVSTYENTFNTGNPALDIILYDASRNFKNGAIDFDCITDGCDISFIENYDLYALLGNAFDNAAEYLVSVGREKRFAEFRLGQRGNFIFIEVSNYYEGDGAVRVGMKSTKSDPSVHGYGVKNMQNIVEKYGGELSVSAADGIFYVTAVIPVPTK